MRSRQPRLKNKGVVVAWLVQVLLTSTLRVLEVTRTMKMKMKIKEGHL